MKQKTEQDSLLGGQAPFPGAFCCCLMSGRAEQGPCAVSVELPAVLISETSHQSVL